MPQRFRRLEDRLGAALSSTMTEDQLRQLVDQNIVETDDLDFKRLYEKDEQHRAEFAKDVAAFANSVGGVIVLGVADTRGVATKLMPRDDFGDPEIRRFRSIIAERVHPLVPIETIEVPSVDEPGKSYLLILVPRSLLAPHAVTSPSDRALRYFVRYGSQTAPLSESQVADRYRDRFEMVRGRLDRLDQLMSEGAASLPLREPTLATGVVPESGGHVALDAAKVKHLMEWVAGVSPLSIGGDTIFHFAQASTGVRRVYIREGVRLYTELHSDGSVYFAHSLPSNYIPSMKQAPDNASPVTELQVVDVVGIGLRLAARYATEQAGAWGEAIVEARLIGVPSPDHPVSAPLPIYMAREELVAGGFTLGLGPIRNTIQLQSVPPSRHTVDISAIADDNREWMLASRLVATDLFQAFGVAEVTPISLTGALRTRYLGRNGQKCAQWAESLGIEVDGNPLPGL